MTYIYASGPGAPRIVMADPGQPCLCVGLEPNLFAALLAAAPDAEAQVRSTVMQALRRLLEGEEEQAAVPQQGAG
jgi:hypothetical protein